MRPQQSPLKKGRPATMPDRIDPYYQWLGIRDPERPPNHYRLLGIELYESSVEVIATAADRQMAHLRTYQHGQNVKLSQRLLNEVAAAKLCLLDSLDKANYDAWLRQQNPPDAPPLTPPSVARESSAQQPEIIVEQEERSTSRRGEASSSVNHRRLSMMVLGGSVVLLIVALGFRVWMSGQGNEDDVANRPQQQIGVTTGDIEGDDEEPNPNGDVVPEKKDPTVDDAVDVDATDSESDENVSPMSNEQPSAGQTDTDSVAVPTVTPWDRLDNSASSDRLQFDAANVYQAVLAALSERDLESAKAMMERIVPVNSAERQVRDELELLVYNAERFWQALGTAKSEIQVGSQLVMRGTPVEVTEVDGRQLTLKTAQGQTKTFPLISTTLDPELAIGLIDFRFQKAPGPGWRLIGSFLMLDKDGNITRGKQFLKKAQQHGFASDSLARAIEVVMKGEPARVVAVPPAAKDPDDSRAGPAADKRLPIPTSSERALARQRLKDSGLWGQTADEFLEVARSEAGRPTAQYELLREAERLAVVHRDLNAGLDATDQLFERFQTDRWQEQYEFLRQLIRSSKGEARNDLTRVALALSSQAVVDDNYQDAKRFANLAVSIVRKDPVARPHVTQRKIHVDTVEREFAASREAAEQLVQSGDNPAANLIVGEFLCFAKGDFENGLPHLKVGEDASLRKLAEADLARPARSAERKSVADGWRAIARQKRGLHQLHALDRARYWYDLSLTGANPAEIVDTRKTLNRVVERIGLLDKVLDATELYPNASKTGYGTLGVNENQKLNVGRIRPLPQHNGKEVSRFLWAHAPSEIEYDVPPEAKTFTAVGVLNGDSTDGVEFIVQVDGKPLFHSGHLRSRGQKTPIRIRIPEGARKIKLVVEERDAVQDDQTYWIAPQFTF